METRVIKPAANQQRSQAAFLAPKQRFDAMVAEVQQMSADHFGADPEVVLWAANGSVEHWNSLLAQVTAAYFQRGEFAR
jgi:hypothetical protein